ncbi:MAG: ABC transporter ATP-binding protein [Myxococcota bacterium]
MAGTNASAPGQDAPLLSVRDLRTYFKTDDGIVKAVDGLSFDLHPGETLGLVGESGSGKSVTNLSILRLIPEPPGFFPSGEVHFEGRDLLKTSQRDLVELRGNRASMIFQDPMSSLNPFLTVERQLTEVLELHKRLSRREARTKAIEMLERVGIPAAAERIRQFPHQFSGGMRQRVMIAMALLCEPALLIADEPTTALDVTIQAQILDLMRALQNDFQTAIILITHDLGVVAGMSDRVAVMYAGRIVEHGRTEEIFASPEHPYTKGLLKSVPRMDIDHTALESIPGLPPDLSNLPPGCPFAPRCEHRESRCDRHAPTPTDLGANRYARCHLLEPRP